MDVRGPQKAQGVALAGGGASQPAHRGLGAGRPQRGHGPALVGATAGVLAGAALLVFHGPVGELRGRATWESYVGVLPRWQHRRSPKGSGGTSIVEAINCSLRQRCGVLVRKSCSFSKSLVMHTARIKIVIDIGLTQKG